MSFKLKVVAGRRRDFVGTITPKVGLQTNLGVITKVNERSLQIDGSTVRNFDKVTVTHSTAVKNGYPHAEGCERLFCRNIVRDGLSVSA